MTTSSSSRATTAASSVPPARNAVFSALIGLASLAVFLQSVWAGMMIREGKDFNAMWVNIHDWGARAAFFLALFATIAALIKLRSRLDLLVGAAALTVLIYLESYIGGIIGDKPSAVAVHIPLSFAILVLAVWLPFRTTRRT